MKCYIICTVLLTTILVPFAVFALEENSVKELKCEDINPEVDLNWLGSIDQWYIPMWSKLYSYRVASDVFQKSVADVTKEEYGPACLIFRKDQTLSAFKKNVNHVITSDGKSFSFNRAWNGGKSGKFNFQMTDNRSYILGITCYEDDQVAWAVLTTKPTLDKSLKAKILARIESLGFSKELVRLEDYSTCDLDARKNEL